MPECQLFAHRRDNSFPVDVPHSTNEHISSTLMIDLDHVGRDEFIKRNFFGIVPRPEGLDKVLLTDQSRDFCLDRNLIRKDAKLRVVLVEFSPRNFFIKRPWVL